MSSANPTISFPSLGIDTKGENSISNSFKNDLENGLAQDPNLAEKISEWNITAAEDPYLVSDLCLLLPYLSPLPPHALSLICTD